MLTSWPVLYVLPPHSMAEKTAHGCCIFLVDTSVRVLISLKPINLICLSNFSLQFRSHCVNSFWMLPLDDFCWNRKKMFSREKQAKTKTWKQDMLNMLPYGVLLLTGRQNVSNSHSSLILILATRKLVRLPYSMSNKGACKAVHFIIQRNLTSGV